MALMHRAIVPDWEAVPKSKHNAWQKLAASSRGVLTPGNFISVAGFVIVLYGLFLLTNNELLAGAIAICIGRLGDALDGAIADFTKTKSPLGESIDAFVDKLIMGLATLVLWAYDLVPKVLIILLLAHVIYNASLVGIAKYRRLRLHASAAGKGGALFEWLAVVAFILQQAAESHHNSWAANSWLVLALVFSAAYVCLSGYSSFKYTQQVWKKISA